MKKFTVAISTVCLTGILTVTAYSNDDKKYLNPDWSKDSTKIVTQQERSNVHMNDCLYKQTDPHKVFVKSITAKQGDVKEAIKTKSEDKKAYAKLAEEKSFDFELKSVATDKRSARVERAYKVGKTVSEFKERKESVATGEKSFSNKVGGDKERESKVFNDKPEKWVQASMTFNNKKDEKQGYYKEIKDAKDTFKSEGKENVI